MSKRTVMAGVVALTACMCWAISASIAEQNSQQAATAQVSKAAVNSGQTLQQAATRPKASPGARQSMIDSADGTTQVVALSNLQEGLNGRIRQIPQEYIDAYLAEQAAGGDAGPHGGACGNLVYESSTIGAQFISGVGNDPEIVWLDDIELAGTDREICEVEITVFAMGTVPTPYTVEFRLYDDCPSDGGTPGPGTVIASAQTQVNATGVQTATFQFPNVLVPDVRPDDPPPCDGTLDFWAGILVLGELENDDAGPIMRTCTPEAVEVGCSDDRFGVETIPVDPGDGCNFFFGGCPDSPTATFMITMWATSTPGICCNLETGVCEDNNDMGVLSSACLGPFDVFTPNILDCDDPMAPVCEAVFGACCDDDTGMCMDQASEGGNGVNIALCQGDDQRFVENPDTGGMVFASCATDFNPECGKGACCVRFTAMDPEGSIADCVENQTEAECFADPLAFRFNLGVTCAEAADAGDVCAVPPDNDECDNKEVLTADLTVVNSPLFGAFEWYQTQELFNSEGATSNTPADDLLVPVNFCAPPVSIDQDVWYNYEIPCDQGALIISTIGSDFDTAFIVYQWQGGGADPGCGPDICPDGADVNPIACSDDIIGGVSRQSYFVFEDVAGLLSSGGDCLKIRVGGFVTPGAGGGAGSFANGGNGVLSIECVEFPPGSIWGRCCFPEKDGGGCTIAADVTECEPESGFFTALTDFAVAGPDTQQFHGCITDPCPGEGEACFNAEDVNVNSMSGPVGDITITRPTTTSARYFKYQIFAETTLFETCGSGYDTVLEIYRINPNNNPGNPGLDDAGNCELNQLIARNDDCDPIAASCATPDATCAGTGEQTSCICLNTDQAGIAIGEVVVICVGARDANDTSPDCATGGVLPLVGPTQDPQDEPVDTVLRIVDNGGAGADCLNCVDQSSCDCCLGDVTGEGTLDGNDIAAWLQAALVDNIGCDDDTGVFCAANTNGDLTLSAADIPTFAGILVNGLECPPAMPVPAVCPEDGLAVDCQSPSQENAWNLDGFVVAENFRPLESKFQSTFCFWTVDDPNGCSTGGGENFTVTYLPSNQDGEPDFDNPIGGPFNTAVGDLVIESKVATGQMPFGGAVEHLYSMSHCPVPLFAGECYWIQIESDNPDCTWFWQWSDDGDSINWAGGIDTDHDLALCFDDLNISEFGCADVVCLPDCGDATEVENEPAENCPDDGTDVNPVDTYNGACEDVAALTNPDERVIDCGSIVCGTGAGWITRCADDTDCADGDTCGMEEANRCDGTISRDIDIYKIDVPGTVGVDAQTVTLTAPADGFSFAYLLGVLTYNPGFAGSGDCAELDGFVIAITGIPCEENALSLDLVAGTHFVLVAQDFNAAVFLLGCELPYKFEVSCEGPLPTGACCIEGECTPDLSQVACLDAGGSAFFEGQACDPGICDSPCLDPDSCQFGDGVNALNATGFDTLENIELTETGSINRLCFTGIYFDGAVDCSEDIAGQQDNYTITYFADAGGAPGAQIAQFSQAGFGSITVTDTGLDLGTNNIFRVEISHGAVPVNAGDCVWVQVLNDLDPGLACSFFWETSAEGDDLAFQDGAPVDPGTDLSICVNLGITTDGCTP